MDKKYESISPGECFKDSQEVVWVKLEDDTSMNVHGFLIDGDEECVGKDEMFQIIPMSEFNQKYKEFVGIDFF